jgi:hypothetical protein
MTRRLVRRLAWVGVALTVVALAFGVTVAVLESAPGVTEANVRRICPGMTPAEVETLLGGPPGDLGIESWPDVGRTVDEWPSRGVWVWNGAAGSAWVRLHGSGRVQSARWVPHQPASFPRLHSLFAK